ncbi:MAG: dicarboxylate/amino acid:cation symporter [Propionibacteriaceae bacterium]|nr:dicarboxylate/amino acid:cation symporter [Propionibacteriaceae bacterium]
MTESSPRARRLPGWATSFGSQILLSLIAGVCLGLAAAALGGDPKSSPNWLMTTLSTIGSSYVALLRTIVVPLIVTAVIASVANLRQVTNAARLAAHTLGWFALTALASVLIGIAAGVVLRPGSDTALTAPASYTGRQGSWLGFLQGLIPSNVFGLEVTTRVTDAGAVSSVSFNVLQLLVISLAVGVAVVRLGERADPFLAFVRSALEVIQKVLWWIIRLAPIGTVGLIGRAMFEYGWDKVGSFGIFVLANYLGLAAVVFGLYPLLLKLNGLSVRRFFSGVWPALQLAFVSRSSVGTLPLTQRVSERNLGVPAGYASFAVPLGATTKMDGCAAVFPAVSAIFVARFFGLELSLTQYLLIVVVAVLGSAATAGTTGAVVMLTLTLSTLGLPLEGVGLLLAIDPILDMGRTAVNVAGQALVPTIVAKRQGILDEDRYAAPNRAGALADA